MSRFLHPQNSRHVRVAGYHGVRMTEIDRVLKGTVLRSILCRLNMKLTGPLDCCTMYAGVCMPLLQVRDCPDDVYQKITRVARREKRTIAQQVVVLLETSLGQEQSNLERRRKLMEKINQRTIPEGVRNVDAVKLIQEDRNR